MEKGRFGIKKLRKLELRELEQNHKNLNDPLVCGSDKQNGVVVLARSAQFISLIGETVKGMEITTKNSKVLAQFLKVCVKGGREKQLVQSINAGTMCKSQAKKMIIKGVPSAIGGNGNEGNKDKHADEDEKSEE